jgi:hypothetical protein
MNNCYYMKILCTILVATHLKSQLNLKISIATATHIMHKSQCKSVGFELD